ncbi:carboxylating nicotinate-nucleotide diphosphorylase [Hathewaya histolytica]|uniref:Probable nicotinate-nucleotide pyrophosphorylase [carboxylating] n=1 Tax=Hathewaya histolytica TaxID=1498 RepID=A0A4U9RMP4_HATHI|nr:carboxylating nicotinate-nucleotide diphosphorylase [Hathewaya histolytica]VTQ93239.1 nicotinate-nucleotide diphosphorylase [Hathewaya histolytica]
MNWFIIDKIIKDALSEDISFGDVTTEGIISEESFCSVDLIAKEEGIIAGIEVFKRVYSIVGEVDVEFFISEGEKVNKGQVIGIVKGRTRKVLLGERVSLNLLQRLSGIASLTRKFVDKLEGTKVKLLDTRKTTPNLRILEKYAVRVGGGYNHRFNLSDGVLIKDNHIDAAGGIKEAIERAREYAPFVRKIEVEVENLEEVKEALYAEADIIMLDNMNVDTIKEALKIIDGKAEVEVSGNVTLDTIKSIANTGVDYISSGYLTHSYKAFDLSMKNLRILK